MYRRYHPQNTTSSSGFLGSTNPSNSLKNPKEIISPIKNYRPSEVLKAHDQTLNDQNKKKEEEIVKINNQKYGINSRYINRSYQNIKNHKSGLDKTINKDFEKNFEHQNNSQKIHDISNKNKLNHNKKNRIVKPEYEKLDSHRQNFKERPISRPLNANAFNNKSRGETEFRENIKRENYKSYKKHNFENFPSNDKINNDYDEFDNREKKHYESKKKIKKNFFSKFIPSGFYNFKTKKILGFLSAEDLFLVSLILLLIESGEEEDKNMVYALGFILASEWIDFSQFGLD